MPHRSCTDSSNMSLGPASTVISHSTTRQLFLIVDASDYLYRLSPPTAEGPYPSEDQLLEALRNLNRTETLSGRMVHIYERAQIGRTYIGKVPASTVLMVGGVDEDRIEA